MTTLLSRLGYSSNCQSGPRNVNSGEPCFSTRGNPGSPTRRTDRKLNASCHVAPVTVTNLEGVNSAMEQLNVVTGATGLLGSHVAEQLVARGERVRALVRQSSDVTFLRGLGVELAEGDLKDFASLQRAVTGADVVYHCAAQVGEWGPWRVFR